jgi:hypothetical protein
MQFAWNDKYSYSYSYNNNNNNNNNNCIVPIKGPRGGRELHIQQILIQCTYNNTTCYAAQNQR